MLSYYSPKYIRTETLIKGLQRLDGVILYQARNSSKRAVRYLETFWKLFLIRILHNPQYYILGFRGYEFFWIVRLITQGKFLIFDHMMSPYDSLLNEKSAIRKGGWIDKTIFLYEKSILYAADLVLTDTDIHKQYFHKLFNLPLEKIEAIPVGADETLFQTSDSSSSYAYSDYFEVLYYGSFLPLHGIDVMLKAAFLLRKNPIRFTLIGGNRIDLSDFHHKLEQLSLNNVKHIDWVEFEELLIHISHADIGLGGPFGNTGQARRVITGKTFQFLAMEKPVIIGKYYGDDNHFEDKINCLLVQQGDEAALADAILWAFEHQESLKSIGQRGYELYKSKYSIERISEKLKGVLSL